MKNCVISYANGPYVKGLRRLEDSIKSVGFKGDILFWYDTLPPESPTHDESPCAFKIFAFLEAQRRGYDNALWIDATGIAVRNLDTLFKQIEKAGYFLLGSFSASVGEWSSDATLKQFNISREEAMKIPELLTFALGLNFHNQIALEFLEEYRKKAVDGISFRGAPSTVPLADTLNNKNEILSKDSRVHGHRWEQTVASLIAYKLSLKQSIFGSYDIIGHAKKGQPYATHIPFDTILVQNRDIKNVNFLPVVDKWFNRKDILAKIPYFFIGLILAIGRRIKNYLRIYTSHTFDVKIVKAF